MHTRTSPPKHAPINRTIQKAFLAEYLPTLTAQHAALLHMGCYGMPDLIAWCDFEERWLRDHADEPAPCDDRPAPTTDDPQTTSTSKAVV